MTLSYKNKTVRLQDSLLLLNSSLRKLSKDFEVETHPGVFLGQKNVPIESTGAYIPGGKYPLLASAHMTIVTAKVAGVKRVVACTPLIKGDMDLPQA